jgi:hypothetical protein
MLVGSCLATAGAGLISTFDPQSSPAIWIGYQILAGTAFGLAFQAPIMAAQALAAHEDVATTTAILYCKTPSFAIVYSKAHTDMTATVFQLLGAAIFVSTGESIFSNILISSLQSKVPGVDPSAVVAAGASLQGLFPPETLMQIAMCYMDGLRAVFLMAVALAGCASLVSLFAPWVSIKGKVSMGAA